jgi:hypothetical protein
MLQIRHLKARPHDGAGVVCGTVPSYYPNVEKRTLQEKEEAPSLPRGHQQKHAITAERPKRRIRYYVERDPRHHTAACQPRTQPHPEGPPVDQSVSRETCNAHHKFKMHPDYVPSLFSLIKHQLASSSEFLRTLSTVCKPCTSVIPTTYVSTRQDQRSGRAQQQIYQAAQIIRSIMYRWAAAQLLLLLL